MTLSAAERAELRVLANIGIVRPRTCQVVARKVGLDLATAAALLIKETSGGHNEWGHDPVRCGPRGGAVTETNYKRYKARRATCGMQGCGGTQLTWYEYQDMADRLGGCWRPWCNYMVGFKTLYEKIKQLGYARGIAAYNGTGAAAWAYSVSLRANAALIRRRLRKARARA